jgi:hypothetical protein
MIYHCIVVFSGFLYLSARRPVFFFKITKRDWDDQNLTEATESRSGISLETKEQLTLVAAHLT